jgi:hypothetical protein
MPGFDSIEYVDQVVDSYEQPNVIDQDDLARMQAISPSSAVISFEERDYR